MTTPTPTAEPFDAFAQRLADALTTEAGTVAAPPDGLDRIHARVVHRRRARRATWFAAAAALVLIAGTVALALRSTTTDSAPYVDTDTTNLRYPLLGFEPDEPTWGVKEFDPTTGYVVTLSLASPAPPYELSVRVHDDSIRGPLTVEGGRTVEFGGRTATLATTLDGDPALLWEPEPGVDAVITVAEGFVADESEILTVAGQLREIDRRSWIRRMESPVAIGGAPFHVLGLPGATGMRLTHYTVGEDLTTDLPNDASQPTMRLQYRSTTRENADVADRTGFLVADPSVMRGLGFTMGDDEAGLVWRLGLDTALLVFPRSSTPSAAVRTASEITILDLESERTLLQSGW